MFIARKQQWNLDTLQKHQLKWIAHKAIWIPCWDLLKYTTIQKYFVWCFSIPFMIEHLSLFMIKQHLPLVVYFLKERFTA